MTEFIHQGVAGEPGAGVDLFPRVSDFSNVRPMIIAHRDQAQRYPEQSIGAIDESAKSSFVDGIESDVYLTSDGVPVNNHDSTVNANTTSTGNVSGFSADEFASLVVRNRVGVEIDRGSSTSSLRDVIRLRRGKIVAIEPKRSDSLASIFSALEEESVDPDYAIITSFVLQDVIDAAAAGWIAEFLVRDDVDFAAAIAAGVTRVAIDHRATDAEITRWIDAGLDVVGWTVNRRVDRDRMLALGCIGFYSDDCEYVASKNAIRTSDNFRSNQWSPGMLASGESRLVDARGRFDGNGGWGWTTESANNRDFVLQGWACPIRNSARPVDYSIEFDFELTTAGGDWFAFHLSGEGSSDSSYDNNGSADESGYTVLIRRTGNVEIFRIGPSATRIAQTTSSAIAVGEKGRMRINVSETQVTAERLDLSGSVIATTTATNSDFRGSYFHLGRNRIGVMFSNVRVV